VVSQIESSDVLEYSGSLTTPPCAEGVTFLIVKDPLDISVADFNSIKSIVKYNARFIQNSIGKPNMLGVGMVSGTSLAVMPEELAANGTVGGGNGTEAHGTVSLLLTV
jgi:hypothetical protein